MRIAVDLDGVLADTMVTFCTILNKRYSANFTPSSFVRWNAWEIAHISKDEFFRTLDEAWFSWRDIPPIEADISEEVPLIRRFGTIDVVTGRSQDTIQPAKAWLKEHRILYNEFVRTESTVAKAELSYDVFIDDSAELMGRLSSDNRQGILYTQPWNKSASNIPGIFRVDRWAQIPDVLRELSAMKT